MYNARKCKLVADRCTPAGYKRVKRIMKGIKEDIMKPYAEMTKDELVALRKELKAQYREMQGKDLKLDMSRGKPCVEQLDPVSYTHLDVYKRQGKNWIY